jgi:pyruvate,water dikinase
MADHPADSRESRRDPAPAAGTPRAGELIRRLDEAGDDDLSLVGGKGAGLGRLVRLGLPVPPGFVVTTAAYRAVLAAADLAAAEPEALRARLPAIPIPPAIADPILAAYRELGAAGVAVRSSGTAEDLAAASFAGQHDTVLDVAGPAALLDAIRGCWASLWSPRAVAYRRRWGWDERDLALAVVVQAMVSAEWAGVLFTADPVTGRRDRLVVEAAPGLGEALVAGEATGRRCVVDKASLRLLDGEWPLTVGALEALARFGVQVEAAVGRPQDIEWAYADGRCALLQARPLTALPDGSEPGSGRAPGPARRYSRAQRAGAANIMDHFPLPPYPFDYSLFFRPLMERMFAALRALGLAPPPVDEVFVEVAEGVVQVVPPTLRPTPRLLALPLRLPAALRARPEDWLADCRRALVAPARRIDGEDLIGLSDAALLERIEALRCQQLQLAGPRFARFPRGLLASQGLALLLRLAVGRRARELERELLAAVPCVTTAANEELGQLARSIRASEEARALFAAEPPERLPARLGESAAGRAVLAGVDAYLGRYGCREVAMPSAALPAWRDDPSVAYGLLKGLVAGAPADALDDGDGERAERARRAAVAVLSCGRFSVGRRLLAPLFLRLLDATRAFVAFREDSHFYLMLPFPVIRRLALELGRRLVERGILAAPDDVFFLRDDELAALARDGTATPDGGRPPLTAPPAREIVRRRQEARRSVMGWYTPVPAELLEQAGTAGEVRGVAVSPGRAVGSVRIIRSERDFWKLQQGEVLVAPYTNPTWTPLFALAGAVVVDAGGVASHAAIVAREYGLPAVMGAGNATARLRDGQRVLVDGDAGQVVPLDAGGGDGRGAR